MNKFTLQFIVFHVADGYLFVFIDIFSGIGVKKKDEKHPNVTFSSGRMRDMNE